MKIPLKAVVIGLGVVVVLVAGLGFVAMKFGNDFHCSKSEREAMSEFRHFDGEQVDWESNFGVTGGCAGTFTVESEPMEVLTYYRERLRQRGWDVEDGPANSSPLFLHAERGALQFDLGFHGANLPPLDRRPPAEATALANKIQTAEAGNVDSTALKAGETRVNISGGHKN